MTAIIYCAADFFSDGATSKIRDTAVHRFAGKQRQQDRRIRHC
jgi:hypothetical protein